MSTDTRFGIRCGAAFVVALLVLLKWSNFVAANEPHWTDQERLEKRDMVCLGTVLSAKMVGPVDEHANLYLAVVEITGMKKGKKTSVGSKFNVYFEGSASDQGERCPTYAKLVKGETATFYLREMDEPIRAQLKIKSIKEPALFLEMGSDVQKIVEILKIDGPDTERVSISSGSDDGVQIGDVFSVYRDKTPIGRLEVTQVSRDQSLAIVDTDQGAAKFEVGNVVVEDGTFTALHRMIDASKGAALAKEGRMYAEADVHRGLTRILYYGKPWSQGKPFIDDETKYPVVIADGCVVGSDFVSFVGEYNLAMRKHFQKTANAPLGDKK